MKLPLRRSAGRRSEASLKKAGIVPGPDRTGSCSPPSGTRHTSPIDGRLPRRTGTSITLSSSLGRTTTGLVDTWSKSTYLRSARPDDVLRPIRERIAVQSYVGGLVKSFERRTTFIGLLGSLLTSYVNVRHIVLFGTSFHNTTRFLMRLPGNGLVTISPRFRSIARQTRRLLSLP
jgi:hypothetical protein